MVDQPSKWRVRLGVGILALLVVSAGVWVFRPRPTAAIPGLIFAIQIRTDSHPDGEVTKYMGYFRVPSFPYVQRVPFSLGSLRTVRDPLSGSAPATPAATPSSSINGG